MYKYGLIKSELGNIFGVVWSDKGVCSISSGHITAQEALDNISKVYPQAVLGEHSILKLLEEYLLGEKSSFSNINIDYGKATEFQKRVWETARLIPYGEVRTYGELAELVSPGSQRAVGQALGKNPVPILVP